MNKYKTTHPFIFLEEIQCSDKKEQIYYNCKNKTTNWERSPLPITLVEHYFINFIKLLHKMYF